MWSCKHLWAYLFDLGSMLRCILIILFITCLTYYIIKNAIANSFAFDSWSYLEYLRALEEKIDQDWAGISSSLDEIRKSILSRRGCLVNMTADGKNLRESEKFVSKFLNLLPDNSPAEKTKWSAQLPKSNEAIVIPTQVNQIQTFSFSWYR